MKDARDGHLEVMFFRPVLIKYHVYNTYVLGLFVFHVHTKFVGILNVVSYERIDIFRYVSYSMLIGLRITGGRTHRLFIQDMYEYA